MGASEFARRRALITRRAGNRKAFLERALAHLVREAGATPVRVRGKLQGWAMADGAVVCVKERLRDGHAAWDELVRIAHQARHGHIPHRAYRCTFCSGWHLTSQDAKASHSG